MNLLVSLPILIPLLTAAVCLLGWQHPRFQQVLGMIGAFALMISGVVLLLRVSEQGIQVTQIAAWPAPFGITLVADLFAGIMVAISGILGAVIAVYSAATLDRRRQSFSYYALFHVLLMGVCGALLTGDIFNMYVWFEVMLMASFVLMALGSERAQIEGALKYVTVNLVSSAFFLSALGLLYSVTGTLNLADMANKLRILEQPRFLTVLSMFFLVSFGIKAAIFPLFFWLPASYHTPPIAVTALFAGLLTKVGVYSLIRIFTLVFVHDLSFSHTIILALSAVTMITGVLGAIAQSEVRRLLSFHIISQIGYMTMGLGFFTPLGLAGAIFFIVHNILAKSNLFLVSGLAERYGGSYDLRRLGGLWEAHPMLGVLFLIPALALAGIPPSSGFFGKVLLVKAGLEVGEYGLVAVSLAVSLLTLYSMIKIWNEAFWKPAPPPEPTLGLAGLERATPGFASTKGLWLPACALAGLTLAMSFGAESAFRLCLRAGEQLYNPREYIAAVLEGVR